MTEPYLIAHLVRGQPSFDIAIKLQIGAEAGWIIPTSGHRAYPYWEQPLTNIGIGCYNEDLSEVCPDPPEGWPDHYSANDRARNRALEEDTDLAREAAKPGQGVITDIAALLGIVPKPTQIRRR